jgi:hypothetical protein
LPPLTLLILFFSVYRQLFGFGYDHRALVSMASISMSASISMGPMSMTSGIPPMPYEYLISGETSHTMSAAAQEPANNNKGASNNHGAFHYGGALAGGLSAAGLALIVVAAIVLYQKKRSARADQRVAVDATTFASLPTPV